MVCGISEDAGVIIAVQPLERRIACVDRRETRPGAPRAAAEAAAFLADTTEGNLSLAAQQKSKLALLLPEGDLDAGRSRGDRRRGTLRRLSVVEAWLAGDAARACRILASLEAAGEGLPLLVWQLVEDLHALAAVFTAVASGMPLSGALRNARVWGKRQSAMERAVRRVQPSALPSLLIRLASLDAMAKGIGRGNVWDVLRELALALAGRPLPAAA
jgi:DNA polymerase-3 subunit delta